MLTLYKEVSPTFKVGRCLLHDRLKERNLSQQELADKIHMPRQQVSDYANDRITMSLRNAKVIASAINCRIEDLYEWIPIKPSDRSTKKGGKA